MGTGIKYKIGFAYLFLFLLFMALSIKPIDRPIADGEDYYRAATNYKLFLAGKMGDSLNYLHRDRMLPASSAGFLADIFNIPVSVAFHLVALAVLVLFYYFSWHLLAGKVTDILALTSLWICYTLNSYPITWNLYNVYQLTDSINYVWTALIVISFVRKNLYLFIPISFLAIITKQNLWFLVLPGYIYFWLHYRRTENTKKLILTAFFGLVMAAIVFLMFITEAGFIKKSLSFGLDKIFRPSTYQGRELRVIKELAWIYLPILPVILIKYKEVYRKSLEYFPFVVLYLISSIIILPASLLEPSLDAYMRIMQPIVWPLCAYVIVLIVNDFNELKNKYVSGGLYLAPIIFGVAHLPFFTISFKPLFFFPAAFRHLLILFLVIGYVMVWRQRKAGKLTRTEQAS